MPQTTTQAERMTHFIKNEVFQDKWWEREFFIDEWIISDEPSHAMPMEMLEQRPDLGAIHLSLDGDPVYYDPSEEPRIMIELLFMTAERFEEKKEAAYAWVRATAARDIRANVVIYTLSDDWRDFATLSMVAMPWLPGDIKAGDHIHYQGIAYPIPGRGIALRAGGEFELGRNFEDDYGELWFEVHNIHNDEDLYITGSLLTTATFANA